MKANTLLLLIGLLLSVTAQAQRNADRLIDALKKDDASVTVKVPGWLIEKAFKWGVKNELSDGDVATEEDILHQERDMEAWKSISESIKQVRVSVVEEALDPNTASRAQAFVDRLKEEDNFESYATIRSEGDKIEVMVRETGNKIKNILLYISGAETLAAIHVKGNIDLKDFEQAQFSWQKNK